MLEVLFKVLTVDEDIIKKVGHEIIQLFFEELAHVALESCGRIALSKWQLFVLIVAPVGR